MAVACVAGLTANVLATEEPRAAGWAVHYYGGPAFWFHAGAVVTPGPELALNTDQLRWPPQNWDAAKGPVFVREGGWSLAAYAMLHVDKSGNYRFATEGGNAMLRVNGRQIDPVAQATVRLEAGEAALALFVKPSASPAKPADNLVKVRVLWQGPGADALTPLPAEALSHSAADLAREQVYTPGIALDYAKGEQVWLTQRRFTVDLPEEGLYEIASHFGGMPRFFKVDLDGRPLLYVQGDRQGVADPRFEASDKAGATDRQRMDFLHRSRAVRPLERGRHTLDVYAHYGPWVWEDEMPEAMRNFRLGLTRMGAADPMNALAVYARDRGDMVFKRGEPLVVGVEQDTEAAQAYRMEVTEQRGDGKPVWEKALTLAAGNRRARGEFKYPCDVEGAFLYTVRDDAGRAVDGPWAFVVVDPAPLPRPRNAPGAPVGEGRRILVDSVDCTRTDDAEHEFRDNNTSRVIQGPGGEYRVTGTAKLRPVDYIQDGKAWRRTQPGEKAQATYYAADWFAYTMKVKHPGRAHLVVGQVPNDLKRLVSMYAMDQITGQYNGWVLDAGDAPASGPFSPLAFVVWPNNEKLDVMVWCSNDCHHSPLNRQGAMAKIDLYELPDGLPPLPAAAGGWPSRAEFGWDGEQVDLGVNERAMPSLWPGDDPIPCNAAAVRGDPYHDWKALQTAWERFGQVSAYRGDNLCSVPVHTYGMNFLQGDAERMLPRLSDVYSTGYRARVEDPFERDIFKLVLLTAQKYGVRIAADFMVHRLENVVPLLARQAGVAPDGILLTDDTGNPWRGVNGITMLNPANPVARRYLVDAMEAMGKDYGRYPAFAGVRLRGWVGWPSGLDAWFYSGTLGYDDATVALFTRETGVSVPCAATNETRFSIRRDYLLGVGRDAWLAWRCQKVLSLREEMLGALRRHNPAARLFSDVLNGDPVFMRNGWKDPRLREGGIDPAFMADRFDLGWSPGIAGFSGEGVEWNAPDPVEFANFDRRQPESVRRTMDNMTGGSLNPSQGFEYPQGMNCFNSYRSHPYQLEKPALALAEGRLQVARMGGPWCLPPADEGLRRFVQAWRAIPPLDYTRYAGGDGETNGPVACWVAPQGRGLVLYLVNRTDKRRQVALRFDRDMRNATDLVGGRTWKGGAALQQDLDPFMPAVFRVEGVKTMAAMSVTANPEEVAELGRRVDHLRRLRAAARGHAQPVIGPDLTGDGVFGQTDSTRAFDQLFLPIETAWQAGRWNEAACLLAGFHQDHLWWYEAFGWPADFYVPRDSADGQRAAGANLQARLKPGSEAAFGEVAPFKEKLLLVPSGRATVRFNPGSGRFHLRMWGLFGGDYGSVRVEYRGQTVGRLGVPGGPERLIHQLLPVPLPWPWSPQEITLVSEGKRGLAIQALEVSLVPPSPVRKWSVIGPFDKQAGLDDWAGMEKAFPPEQAIDLKAAYSGLGGTIAAWRQIDLGERKYANLLDLFPSAADGRGVAYLAVWVRSPDNRPRDATLYYAMDWYGKVWLNGEPVLPKVNGPWTRFEMQSVKLKPGWNSLLVKSGRGRGGWKAAFAFSDPGDLEYQATPPGVGMGSPQK